MKKTLCIILITLTGGWLYGQTEVTDTIDNETTDQSGIVEIVEAASEENVDPDPPLLFAEVMPQFVYKENTDLYSSFRNYVADSIRIPSVNCHGKIYVQFVVERDSTIDNIEILRGLPECPGYEQEIKRLFSTMPLWIPGRQGGMPVRVKYMMPVEFVPKK